MYLHFKFKSKSYVWALSPEDKHLSRKIPGTRPFNNLMFVVYKNFGKIMLKRMVYIFLIKIKTNSEKSKQNQQRKFVLGA